MNLTIHAPRFLTAAMAIAVAASSFGSGPTSTLYATNKAAFGASNGLDRIQGASFSASTTGNSDDYGLAVWGDVRTVGYFGGAVGSQFDLNGNLLGGGPYQDTYAADPIYDGTSDGKYNYGVGYFGGSIIQYDRNWANPIVLFTDSNFTNHAGITMNVGDGSFWVSQYKAGDEVEHFSHTGTLLGSFNSGIRGTLGMALDPLDGTLWLNNTFSPTTLYQYDQAGNLLQQVNYGPTGVTWYGMEFNGAPVPEPASIAALAVGALALRRRRK